MQTTHSRTRTTAFAALTGVAFVAALSLSTNAVGQDDPSAEEDEALMGALIEEGRDVYSSCSGCHGRQGEGQPPGQDAAPALAGNYSLLSVAGVVNQITNGGDYMPPFPNLTAREIAAVITYARNSFGNDYGFVTEEEVAAELGGDEASGESASGAAAPAQEGEHGSM